MALMVPREHFIHTIIQFGLVFFEKAIHCFIFELEINITKNEIINLYFFIGLFTLLSFFTNLNYWYYY